MEAQTTLLVEEKKYQKNNRFRVILRCILIFFSIFLSGLIVFRNDFLITKESIKTKSANDGILFNYSYRADSDVFVANNNDAYLSFTETDFKFKELRLDFYGSGISSDVTLKLYSSKDSQNFTIVQTKIVKKYTKSISLYIDGLKGSTIKLLILSKQETSFPDIPNFTMSVLSWKYGAGQNISMWIVRLLILFFVSATIGFFVGTDFLKIFIKKSDDLSNSSVSGTAVKKNRESNLELLRIICMLCIIGHHISVHGGLFYQPINSQAHIIGLIFLPLGKICFLAFIAISMWFLSDVRKANFTRFITVWIEVIFYSIVFTLITGASYSVPLDLKDYFASFFVMIGNSHGFAASYLIFLLLLPFLQMGTKSLTKKQGRLLLLLLFCMQVLSQILCNYFDYIQPIFSEPLLFIFCYVLSINLKRWPVKIFDNKIFSGSILLACYLIILLNAVLSTIPGYNADLNRFILYLSQDESSVLFIIAGYALFYLFKNIHIGQHKWINFTASFTFAVLLIHDHNFFRRTFWYDVVKTQTFYDSNLVIFHTFFAIIAIYFVCATIEYLRKKMIEEPFLNTDYVRRTINNYNSLFIE